MRTDALIPFQSSNLPGADVIFFNRCILGNPSLASSVLPCGQLLLNVLFQFSPATSSRPKEVVGLFPYLLDYKRSNDSTILPVVKTESYFLQSKLRQG